VDTAAIRMTTPNLSAIIEIFDRFPTRFQLLDLRLTKKTRSLTMKWRHSTKITTILEKSPIYRDGFEAVARIRYGLIPVLPKQANR